MHRFCTFDRIVFLICSLLLLTGCGWTEADGPVPPGDSEKTTADNDARSGSGEDRETDATSSESIQHPFEAEFDVDPSGSETTEESEEVDDLCTLTCLQATWCRDDEIGDDQLVECIDSCEFVLEENFVDRANVECVAEADDCDQARDCYGQFQACDDVCQWHDNCEGHDGRAECTRWCGGEIWSGELRWDAYGCLIDTVEGACPAFGLCGVTPPGD